MREYFYPLFLFLYFLRSGRVIMIYDFLLWFYHKSLAYHISFKSCCFDFLFLSRMGSKSMKLTYVETVYLLLLGAACVLFLGGTFLYSLSFSCSYFQAFLLSRADGSGGSEDHGTHSLTAWTRSGQSILAPRTISWSCLDKKYSLDDSPPSYSLLHVQETL